MVLATRLYVVLISLLVLLIPSNGLRCLIPSSKHSSLRWPASAGAGVRGVAANTGKATFRPATAPSTKLGMVVNPLVVTQGVRFAAVLPVMYLLMSFNEYVTHRYYQHNELAKLVKKSGFLDTFVKWAVRGGGGHVEHHAETLDDMSLKTDARWRSSPAALSLDGDKYRGTAFTWNTFALMFLQMSATCIPVLKLILGISPLVTLALIVPSLALHTLVWNSLHPNMHGLEDIPASEGPPANVFAQFRSSKIFKWLYQNHEGHHVLGGLKNYNVCCPGFDHILGTYVEEHVWRPKAKLPVASIKEDVSNFAVSS